MIVVSELPSTRDTLCLRILGAGKVLAAALKELAALPPADLERALLLMRLNNVHFVRSPTDAYS